MTTEDRLREAIEARARAVEPTGEWDHVRERALFARRRRRLRTAGAVVLGAAAAVAVAVLALPALDDQRAERVRVGPADTAPHEEPDGGTAVPPASEEPDTSRYVWDSGTDDQREAALRFAVDYVGMRDPIVGEPDGGTVPVRAFDRGPVTQVRLERVDGVWWVVGAASANIVATSPAPLDEIANPVLVSGDARAFEGTVLVEVREDGQSAGDALGRGFVTGSGGPDLGPFGGAIPYAAPTEPLGAVVLTTESAEDGSLVEATVVRVRFARCAAGGFAAAPEAGEISARIYFGCGEGVAAVARNVPRASPLRGALEALLAGPTPDEESAGIHSSFSEETAGMLLDVTIRDRLAVVDFDEALRDTIPSASSSAASASLIAQLRATILQFDTVDAAELRLGGSCEAFWEWLQSECRVLTRDGG